MSGTNPVTQFPLKATLTDASIDALPFVLSGRAQVRDLKLSQLVLLIGPRSKTFYLHATMHRQTHRLRLGRWPVVGADDARDQCLTALRRLYRGESLKLAKATVSPTLAVVLDEYLTSRQISKKSAADLRCVIGVHGAAWVDRPITELEARAVATQYRVVAAKSLGQAIRLLAALSALTKYSCAAHGVGDATLIQRARSLLGGTQDVAARDVVIPDEQQGKWSAAVGGELAQVARYFRALMLTGLRANELRGLAPTGWASGERVIHIGTTKNGKPHMVCAGDALAALMDAEAAFVGKGAALFTIPVKVYRAACERVGEAVGLDWHLHDLRRTFATVATRAGIDAGTVKRLMNHSTAGDVTAHHYIKLHINDMRASMQIVEARLLELWQGT